LLLAGLGELAPAGLSKQFACPRLDLFGGDTGGVKFALQVFPVRRGAPTATPPVREGFLIRIPSFHASKPIGWTI
jgi:hypothetical protein